MEAKHPRRKRVFSERERTTAVKTAVVHANLDQLANELHAEVERLFSNVSAHEDASVILESQLIELSAALEAASTKKR